MNEVLDLQSSRTQSSHFEDCIIGAEGVFKMYEKDTSNVCIHETVRKPEQKDVKTNETTKFKLFRYLISGMALVSIALALACRMILNIAIVEIANQSLSPEIELSDQANENELDFATTNQPNEESLSSTEIQSHIIGNNNSTKGIPHSNWSRSEQNFVLSSFYFGYGPAMLFLGGLADVYGSKVPILLSVLGGAVMNMITPYLANHSYSMLVASRIILGLLQGALVPSCFDLFNRWLTMSERSIFVPMMKISLAAGGVMGGLVSVLVIKLGYSWPMMFYMTSFICSVFSVAWIILASNEPEGNPFLQKTNQLKQIPISTITKGEKTAPGKEEGNTKEAAPILLIITNMSVIVLGITKFTLGLGLDFLFSMLPIYLRDAHAATSETIGFVVSSGPFLQMFLTIPVAWIARYAIEKESLGLSRTKWRKVFQGIANISTSIGYFLITLVHQDLNMVILIILIISCTTMFSAGGEALIPYDLSKKYPATIMSIAHSFSITGGIIVPLMASAVLGDSKESNPELWNRLFLILSGFCLVGGLLFIFVLKAKPFLPGEREEPEK